MKKTKLKFKLKLTLDGPGTCERVATETRLKWFLIQRHWLRRSKTCHAAEEQEAAVDAQHGHCCLVSSAFALT